MKVSYQWLKSYLPNLPQAEEVAEGIIFHAFEVEEVEQVGNDTVMEVKVLPDRAHDCLSHRGIARELAAIFDLPQLENRAINFSESSIGPVAIQVEDGTLCRRYLGRRVENIQVVESPDWLQERLEVIGQRSINNIVDLTNYVMFDLGQPLHAFDADKVQGSIKVRMAAAGEYLTTLDNKEVALDPSMLVIADDQGPLALAGVKGGKRAEVDKDTKRLILESANFDPVSIRKTSTKSGVRTDTSKRFENELSPVLAEEAMAELTQLIAELNPGLQIGPVTDIYPQPVADWVVNLPVAEISSRLGVSLAKEESVALLERLGLSVQDLGDYLRVTVSPLRLDLEIAENLIEEIARLYGYEKIPGKLPAVSVPARPDRNLQVANKIREILIKRGFSEIYGYAFAPEGEVALAKPLASDLPYLRDNLSNFLLAKIELNLKHVLFDAQAVKLFEIGKIFGSEREETHCALAIGYKSKKQDRSEGDIKETLEDLERSCDVAGNLEPKARSVGTATVLEFNFDKLVELAGDCSDADLSEFVRDVMYNKFSPFPRIIRDVALFVSSGIEPEEVADLIKNSAGDLLVEGPILFDVFEKKNDSGEVEKKSLAYRLVLQSYEKTLSDEEANAVMEGVIVALESKGWEVRK